MSQSQTLSNLSILPPPRIAAVEKALQTIFGTTEIDAITQLAGGLSTALVYKIVVNGEPYVLRVMMHTDAFTDPVRLFACMKLAADTGIAPQIYYADVDDALTITAHVDAKPMHANFPIYDDLLTELAEMVKAIHATPLFPKLVNFMDGVDGFITQFQASQRLPTEATAEHFRLYAKIQQKYPRHDPNVVSSHNDLNYNNILFDGTKFWIIDWEAAFQNDRYVDLANIANGFVNNEAQEETYLRVYFGDALDETKRARFFLMQQTCHFFYAMVMLQMVDARTPKGVLFDAKMQTPSYADFRQLIGTGQVQLSTNEGQLLFAKVMLNEALRKMQSQRFEYALAQM